MSNLISQRCSNCGETIQLPDNLKKAHCIYCGLEIKITNSKKLTSNDCLIEALNFFNSKDYSRTIRSCEKALNRDPQLLKAWYFKSIAYYRQNKLDKVAECLNHIHEVNPAYFGRNEEMSHDELIMAQNNIDDFLKDIYKALDINIAEMKDLKTSAGMFQLAGLTSGMKGRPTMMIYAQDRAKGKKDKLLKKFNNSVLYYNVLNNFGYLDIPIAKRYRNIAGYLGGVEIKEIIDKDILNIKTKVNIQKQQAKEIDNLHIGEFKCSCPKCGWMEYLQKPAKKCPDCGKWLLIIKKIK